MNDEEEIKKILQEFAVFICRDEIQTGGIEAGIMEHMIHVFVKNRFRAKEKILDWNQVADGVLVTSPGATQFIFKKNEFSEIRHFNGLMLDTENLNAWRGGDCPFGQTEAVRVECELRNGAIRRDQAAHLCWGHERAEGDVLNYRVIGLSAGWKYPE